MNIVFKPLRSCSCLSLITSLIVGIPCNPQAIALGSDSLDQLAQVPDNVTPDRLRVTPSGTDANNDRFLNPNLSPSPTPLPPQTVPIRIPDSELRNGCNNTNLPITIRSIVFTYNHTNPGMYSDEELLALDPQLSEKITQGEAITLADVCNLVELITTHYVTDGYYTSRAFIPQQRIDQKQTITISILEGILYESDIKILGLNRLPESYIRDRIALGIHENQLFRYQNIEDQLQLLQGDPLIRSISAAVGYRDADNPRPPRMELIITVEEQRPISGSIEINNYGSESVGSERFTTELTYNNISGVGDALTGSWTQGWEGGMGIYRMAYRAPLNPQGGTLRLQTTIDRTKVIQDPFADFNIQGAGESYEVSIRQPLMRTPRQEFALAMGYSFLRNQTFIQEQGLAFNRGPNATGTSRLGVFRFSQDFVRRNNTGVLALKSQLNWGNSFLDATVNSNNDPDSEFLSWLLQAQRVQRLDSLNVLLSRLDLQLANDGLMNPEQFLIGGAQSVRGYRQNLRSADNGVYFSLENRMQAVKDQAGRSLLQVAPFVDLGYVWNSVNNTNLSQNNRFLSGLGVGFLWSPHTDLNFRLDYGYALTDLSPDDRGSDALQSQGIHFNVNYGFN